MLRPTKRSSAVGIAVALIVVASLSGIHVPAWAQAPANVGMPPPTLSPQTPCPPAPCPTGAGPRAAEEARWRNSITPYLWLPAQDGDAVVRGIPVNVDVTLGDAWDALSELDGALAFHYEGSKVPWTVIADFFWVRLDSTHSTGLGIVGFRPSQIIGEIDGAYEVMRKPGRAQQLTTVDVLAGARYNRLKLSVTGPAGGVIEESESWVDPIIGARVIHRFNPQWAVHARGDIGGFGISGDSDFVWNVILGLQYDFSDTWGVDLGWRWLDYDFQTGSGTDEFKYDVLMQGPFLGAKYSF